MSGITRKRLTDAEWREILLSVEDLTRAELARRLGREYHTVHKAVRRLLAGRVRCDLSWHPCAVCGRPISGPRSRKTHVECTPAWTRRRKRKRRALKPGESTPYVRRYRRENPERAARLREEELARRRERWREKPHGVREGALSTLHAADRRDAALTRAKVRSAGARWTPDEDRQVIERLAEPARDVALDLGRSLWAVRQRRVRLRRMIEDGTYDAEDLTMNLRERIARVYAAHPRGKARSKATGDIRDLGQTWLAGEADVSPSTVRRWVQRDKPSRYGDMVLERLEKEARDHVRQ